MKTVDGSSAPERARTKMRAKRRAALACGFCFLLACSIWFAARSSRAQSGVLVPSSAAGSAVTGSLLSLAVMNVDVLIDNNHARVRVLQIYDNRTAQTLEGKYTFALPPRAVVSDFAVWDADARIPGVMMERRRAAGVYAQIKQQPIDPGLLQIDDEQGGFAARVSPIAPHGTKRLELEYTETLPVEGLTARFAFGLKPSSGAAQRVGEFNLHVRVTSEHPIAALDLSRDAYPLATLRQTPNEYEGALKLSDVVLSEDFALDYRLDVPQSALAFLAYRAPQVVAADELRDPAGAGANPDGYFQAAALFNEAGAGDPSRAGAPEPRRVCVLLDTSLSMHGDKLRRAVEAIELFLHSLGADDLFDLVLFDDDASVFSPEPVRATPENVERALAFLRGSSLAGGTDLRRALGVAAEIAAKFPAGERSVVVISDFRPTAGTTRVEEMLAALDRPEGGSRPRVFAFGFGADRGESFSRELAAATHGYSGGANETDDARVTLRLFFGKIGRTSIEDARFASSEAANFYDLYPSVTHSFDGSSLSFVGRYRRPSPAASVRLTARFGARDVKLSREVLLPERDATHEHLPRLWARARVDHLLDLMNREGEREEFIAEIIRLARAHKFVTPYTSFIAAPRALLRPRLIQPGDPVLRVKTDPSVREVFAVLPFGETLPLRFSKKRGVWETRFLAPAWMEDGAYSCRLLLTDANGKVYEERKSFVVDSRAPELRLLSEHEPARAGDELLLRVAAGADARRVTARIYGAAPVELRWSDAAQACAGRLRVPAALAAGDYPLIITAEDGAHNETRIERRVRVRER